jgi:hypothetical protein
MMLRSMQYFFYIWILKPIKRYKKFLDHSIDQFRLIICIPENFWDVSIVFVVKSSFSTEEDLIQTLKGETDSVLSVLCIDGLFANERDENEFTQIPVFFNVVQPKITYARGWYLTPSSLIGTRFHLLMCLHTSGAIHTI